MFEKLEAKRDFYFPLEARLALSTCVTSEQVISNLIWVNLPTQHDALQTINDHHHKTVDKLGTKLRKMSRDARKPVFGVSDQVQHKPACTSSEKS